MLDKEGLIANIVLLNLPAKVRGFTVPNSDDTYTICLNINHTLEMHQATVLHEMEHIGHGDWSGCFDINELELVRHG